MRKIGSEYIIVDPGLDMVDMSMVYSFNETAAWLWERLLDIDFNEDTIADLLFDRYEVAWEVALADARGLVQVFKDQDLLLR